MPASGARALTLVIALALPAGPAAAGWEVHEHALLEGDGMRVAAEAFSASGEARVSVGCQPNGIRYVALDYVGYRTLAEALRVHYRVDSRNAIASLWPTAAHTVLRVYNSDPVYVDEFARRTMAGWRLTMDVELLPQQSFSLRGSRRAITAALDRCREMAEPPDPEEDEDGEEDGSDDAGNAGRGDGEDVVTAEPLSMPF
jgi:hypothetical protein